MIELGTQPDGDGFRDAIHIAIIAQTADRPLLAGERLQHGVVDPFLTKRVEAGERFWLLLFPNTITSLRHEWLHPAFPVTTAVDRTPHEKWMRDWAIEHMSYDYYGDNKRVSDDAAYAFAIEAGHRLDVGPHENARDYIDSEWWNHWEAITGKAGQRDGYFSCAC